MLDEPEPPEVVENDTPILVKSFDKRGKTFIPVNKKVNVKKTRLKNRSAATKPTKTAKNEKMDESTVSAPVLPPLPNGSTIKSGQQAKFEIKPIAKKKKMKPLSTASIPVESKFTIRVKTFSIRDDAEQLKAELLQKGYHAYVFKNLTSKRTWHVVNVGGYAKRSAAEEVAQNLKSDEGYSKARVDRYRK